MNKTAIRNFAVWARNKLISDVTYRAGLMGVTASGIADPLPQSTDNVQFFDIGMSEPYQITSEEIKQRKSLVEIINRKEKDSDYATAFTSVVEEVAYTWFNRLIAIRFMEVNDYLPSHIRVLSSESGKLEPDLVTTPYDAELLFANGEEQVVQNLKNENKLDEVFRMLFIKQCNALYEILPRLFENLSDYTELLLNVSFIDQDGVVYHLVHDIPEEDFNVELGGQVEIIGWLYQYYNAELKDETFALLKDNVKVTKERVPSATQLFTPDWVVRYMVENSLGRFWLNGHKNDLLKEELNYFLDEKDQLAEVKQTLDDIYKRHAEYELTDIKFMDPCMGSGHVLVYAFDIFMKIYVSEGYTERDAAKIILENNIYGLDIDDRAAQLAYFAVMMKARQYNRRIFSDKSRCNVFSIQESNGFERSCLSRLGDLQLIGELLIKDFKDAKEYGSILQLNDISVDDLNKLKAKLQEIEEVTDYGDLFAQFESTYLVKTFSAFINQAFIMKQKYQVIVTNPPYMGSSNMSEKLLTYVKDYYPDTKSDMSTVCMEKTISMLDEYGYMAMINIPVWMFIVSYEKLRQNILENNMFINMLHLGRGVFGSDFGTTAFVICKNKVSGYLGRYYRLFNKQVEVVNNEEKEKRFFDRKGENFSNQDTFFNIPGSPIAYWLSSQFLDVFKKAHKLGTIADSRQGLATGENNRFIRLWNEVDFCNTCFDASNTDEAIESSKKWFPYNKGGDFRKWYGNNDYVVNWQNDGYEIKNFKDKKGKLRSRPQNLQYYFRESFSWSLVSSSVAAFRYKEKGCIFDVGGMSCFSNDNLKLLLALCNTKVTMEVLNVIAPTINYQCGDIANIPVLTIDGSTKEEIEEITNNCIKISKEDWDSFETSWNFKKNPLI